MTFSIAARSADGRWLGVAVASRVLAVGRAVPEAAVGAGAVATQALCNMTYRPRGIEMLRRGMSAGETVAALLEHDDQREHRQVGIVDRDGGSASHTGSQCLNWAGGVTGPGYAIQGNILAGEHVVLAMQRAWLAGSEDRAIWAPSGGGPTRRRPRRRRPEGPTERGDPRRHAGWRARSTPHGRQLRHRQRTHQLARR